MSERFLCCVDDVPDGGARVVDGSPGDGALVVVRRGASVWAYVNRCPHFSVRLDFEPGEVCTYRSKVLMCAHHSALFAFENGHCIEGPCEGAALTPVPVRVVGVDVWSGAAA